MHLHHGLVGRGPGPDLHARAGRRPHALIAPELETLAALGERGEPGCRLFIGLLDGLPRDDRHRHARRVAEELRLKGGKLLGRGERIHVVPACDHRAARRERIAGDCVHEAALGGCMLEVPDAVAPHVGERLFVEPRSGEPGVQDRHHGGHALRVGLGPDAVVELFGVAHHRDLCVPCNTADVGGRKRADPGPHRQRECGGHGEKAVIDRGRAARKPQVEGRPARERRILDDHELQTVGEFESTGAARARGRRQNRRFGRDGTGGRREIERHGPPHLGPGLCGRGDALRPSGAKRGLRRLLGGARNGAELDAGGKER